LNIFATDDVKAAKGKTRSEKETEGTKEKRGRARTLKRIRGTV
jgi:hypothetical protein